MAISLTLSPDTSGQLRPLNMVRDLSPVADLIELCFKTTMDSEGRQFLQQMRRSSSDSRFLGWAAHAVDTISLPLSGYVWDDAGKIVGNVSLIPFRKDKQKIYLVANVAVHPDYRRRGIARVLTDSAVRHARTKSADTIWLHVRDDNSGAITLYQELGFKERMRRSTWHANPNHVMPESPEGYTIIRRGASDWTEQSRWLARDYPDALYWYNSPHWDSFRPGLWPSMVRMFSDTNLDQWAVFKGRKLKGVLSVQSGMSRTAHAWAAVPPDDGEALTALLIHARRTIGGYHTINLDFPGGEHVEFIQMAGFKLSRTLVWMQAQGAQPKR